jgi:hypothetical protein
VKKALGALDRPVLPVPRESVIERDGVCPTCAPLWPTLILSTRYCRIQTTAVICHALSNSMRPMLKADPFTLSASSRASAMASH